MTVSKKDGQLVILLSGVIIIIPMVLFPARLGLDISTGSFSYAIIEILWYAAVFFVMRSNASILQVFQGAGLTFLYRIVIGTIFGLFVAVMYGVNISAALSMGVSRYFPAILLHIIAAPFIAKPFYLAILGETEDNRGRRKYVPRLAGVEEKSAEQAVTTISPDELSGGQVSSVQSRNSRPESHPEFVLGHDLNGFERAIRYLGEHSAVKLAAIVDHEGLTVASYHREGMDVEAWAPLAGLFKEYNSNIIKRNNSSPGLQRIDLFIEQERIFILGVAGFNIMAISNREDDDLVGVRLHQAAEMVKKYISERYGRIMPSSPEGKYVSSTGRIK